MASTLAVIVLLYGQRAEDNEDRIAEALLAQTRWPDELWLLAETTKAHFIIPRLICAERGYDGGGLIRVHEVHTPRDANGDYAVIPYSLKSNYVLDRTKADYITYLTDDSWPAPEKYERMVAALDENPDWGAVFCSQDKGDGVRSASDIERDAFCRVDHTQVMHRRTADRWPEEIADIMLGDAIFWRKLHASLGPFYPVPGEPLDFVRQTPSGISAGNRS